MPVEPGSHNRPRWEKTREFAELLISAIGPVAELIDALARILH